MCCGWEGLGERYNRGTLFGTRSDFSGSVHLSVQFSAQTSSWGVHGVNHPWWIV